MALLSYSSSPQKGSSVTVTLDTALLLSLNAVTSDPFWDGGNDGDIAQAIVTLKTSPGNGKIVLTFDLSQDPCTATLTLPQYTRDMFEISKIVLIDTMGDKLTLDRAALLSEIPTLSESEISLAQISILILGTKAWTDSSIGTSSAYWQGTNASSMSYNLITAPAYKEHAYFSSMEISGGDVYIAGRYQYMGNSWGCYWKNDTIHFLEVPQGCYASYATSIAIDGTDVYVCGWVQGGNNVSGTRAVIWKNGVCSVIAPPENPTGGYYYSLLNSIKVSPVDGSVHACGYYAGPGTGNVVKPMYCVENTTSTLTLPAGGADVRGYSFGLVVGDSGDVYIAGRQYMTSGGNYVNGSDSAVLWTNSSPEILPTSYDNGIEVITYTRSSAEALCISAGSVYVAGLGRNETSLSNDGIVWYKTSPTEAAVLSFPMGVSQPWSISYSESEGVPYITGQAQIGGYSAIARNDTIVSDLGGQPYAMAKVDGTTVYLGGSFGLHLGANAVEVRSCPVPITGETFETLFFAQGPERQPSSFSPMGLLAKNEIVTAMVSSVSYDGYNELGATPILNKTVGATTSQIILQSGFDITANPADKDSFVNGVAVDGSTVYSFGQAYSDTTMLPALWTDQSLSFLGLGAGSQAYCTAGTVYDGSIYAAGQLYEEGVGWRNVVWQDGEIIHDLADSVDIGYPYAIHVDATGVYVCGSTFLDQAQATLWKDGEVFFLHALPEGSWGSEAYAMTVKDGSIFLCGYVNDPDTGYDTALVIELDAATGSLIGEVSLPTGDYQGYGYANSITYGPDGNQYVAGNIYFDEFYLPGDPLTALYGDRPVLWKNGELVFLPITTIIGGAYTVKVG